LAPAPRTARRRRDDATCRFGRGGHDMRSVANPTPSRRRGRTARA